MLLPLRFLALLIDQQLDEVCLKVVIELVQAMRGHPTLRVLITVLTCLKQLF